MAQVDELEVYNAGLGTGIAHGLKYAWTKWDNETGEIPDIGVKCVGLWIHTTKRSHAGCHAECFTLEHEGDGDGGYDTEGLNGTELRSGLRPDFWIPMPKKGDH